MRKIFLSFVLFTMSIVAAMAQGIQFEHDTNWKQALAKAKETNKLIFVDIYTTWCGPCKMMAKEVFPTEIVGKYFNANFLNFKIDAEKGEGIELANNYAVRAYPTYLFVNGDGQLVHKFVGAVPPEQFVEVGKKAIQAASSTEDINYFKENYESKKNDTAFLNKYIDKLTVLEMNASEPINHLISILPEESRVSTQVFHLINSSANFSTTDNHVFQFYLKNKQAFDKLGNDVKEKGNSMCLNMVFKDISTAARKKDEAKLATLIQILTNAEIANDKILNDLYERFYKISGNEQKYFEYASKICDQYLAMSLDSILKKDKEYLEMNLEYVKNNTSDPEKRKTMVDMLQSKYQHVMSAYYAQKLNQTAWTEVESFQELKDKNRLKKALAWSKFSLQLEPENYNYIDTYACLEYLLSNKSQALKSAEQALKLVKGSEEEASFAQRVAEIKAGKTLQLD